MALAMALAAGAAYAVSKRTVPVYQAATSLLINEAPANKTTDYSALVASERIAQTYAQMMVKEPVLEGVIQQLGLEARASELKGAVQVQPVRDTSLIDVKVEDTDPRRAALIANTLVAVFTEQNQAMQASRYTASKDSLETQLNDLEAQIKANGEALAELGEGEEYLAERDRLQTLQSQYRQTYAYLLQSYEQVRLAEAQSTSSIVQVEPAKAPRSPIRPRTLVNTALAGVVGLMLAVGVIFLIEALDDTLGPEDITQRLGLPVLGVISRHNGNGSKPVTALEPRSPVSESFRSLRTNIQFAGVDKPLKRVLVTSPSPEDGKSTVAANLAVTLAQGGKRVALIDADLRRPRVHKVLGLQNRQGMTALFVQSKVALNGHLQETEVNNLCALTTGILPPNPSELLGSDKMAEIMEQIGERVDVQVIDTPPVMAVTDAAVLAPKTDGVVLVVKPGVTKLGAASQAVEQLQRVGANLLGVVLNDVEVKRGRYKYAYYHGYYATGDKYYGEEKKEKGERR